MTTALQPGSTTPRHGSAHARPKVVPTGTPIDTGHYRVRHDRIDGFGVITLRHNSRSPPPPGSGAAVRIAAPRRVAAPQMDEHHSTHATSCRTASCQEFLRG